MRILKWWLKDESGCNFPLKAVRWIRMHRVSFEDLDISALHSLSKHCRSIFYFPEWPKYSINLKIFSLLRVLYVTDEFHLPSPTVHIHLRYLFLFGVISRLQASHCDQESLTKVPYLKKVSIMIRKPNECNDCMKNIVCLQQLESLSLDVDTWPYEIGGMMAQMINNILLLKNIRKLRFEYLVSEWKVINVLSKLPRLEVLKLMGGNLGEKWEVPENVKFCHLICLKISYRELKHWEAGADNFPKLERLFLEYCIDLREIPNSFAEIPTLNLIQLERCHPCAVMSAKQIEAEQHDYGNENMVVIEEN